MSLIVDIKKIFNDFSLEVAFEAENERMALLGASGSGKSMTLKCIAGIEKPSSGIIKLDGHLLFDSRKGIDLPPQKRRVGYLFQQYALFPNMTVEENIACGIQHMARSKRQKAVTVMIDRMKLSGQEKKRPALLSGGQQQRVALARILINNPKLLMLDEPFSALDSHLRWQLELELIEALESYGGTSLLVSHKQDEVFRLSDSVCVLTDGYAEQKRPVKDLFEAPLTLSECLILGCKNISRARVINDYAVEAIDWGTTLTTCRKIYSDTSHIAVKEEDLVFSSNETQNTINCRIDHIIEDVSSSVVILSTLGGNNGSSRLRVRLPKASGLNLTPSELLNMHIAPSKVMVFNR
jgi:molybdate transport system ATP-binding protein